MSQISLRFWIDFPPIIDGVLLPPISIGATTRDTLSISHFLRKILLSSHPLWRVIFSIQNSEYNLSKRWRKSISHWYKRIWRLSSLKPNAGCLSFVVTIKSLSLFFTRFSTHFVFRWGLLSITIKLTGSFSISFFSSFTQIFASTFPEFREYKSVSCSKS